MMKIPVQPANIRSRRGRTVTPGILIISLCLLSQNLLSQKTIISSGTSMTATGGEIVFFTDLTNNGSFSNTGNRVSFNGTNHVLDGISPAEFHNLTIENGNTVTVSSQNNSVDGILLCNGTLYPGGNIILRSTASGTALIDGEGTGQVSGNIKMERYLPDGFGYRYISSPFQSTQAGAFEDDTDLTTGLPLIYRYDESRSSSGWVYFSNPTALLNPFQGYAVNLGVQGVPVTIRLTGIPGNGSCSVTLYNHNNPVTKGFSLAGNPYPSPIDWDSPSGWSRTNIDDAVYYFNPSSTDQYGGTYSTYMDGVSSNGTATNIIPSMQGFFVHVSDGAWPVEGSMTINNDARLTDQTHPFAKSGYKEERSLIRIAAMYSDNEKSSDPFVIYYNDKATANFDGQADALKFFNTDPAIPNFYVFGNDNRGLSINGLPNNGDTLCSLRLGLKTEKDGEIIIKAKDISGIYSNMIINLSDNETGINTDLTGNNEYKVRLPRGDYQNRFFLNFSQVVTDVPETLPYDNLFKAWSSKGILMTDIDPDEKFPAMLKIYDLRGQLMHAEKVTDGGYHEYAPGLNKGIYIVTFESGTRRVPRKIYFDN